MAASKPTDFRENLLAVLMSALRQRDFESWRPSGGNDPLVVHLRRVAGKRRDLFDIQFDKYERRRVFINLASVEGPTVQTMYEGILSAEEITTGHLGNGCRIRGSGLSDAFSPSLLSRLLNRPDAGAKTAQRIIARLDEAEAWFRSKQVGPHLHVYRL